MATSTLHMNAPPERVFDVLSDPRSYRDWVVGSRETRTWDPEFPAPGSSFYHTFQVGPFPIKDSTSVLEVDAPRRLVLRARARPTGVAHVALELEPAGGGTDVSMHEEIVEGLPARLDNPLQQWLTRRRNDEALRRLKRLAERG